MWQEKRRAWFSLALRSGRDIPGKDFCFVADEARVSCVQLPVGKFYSQSAESPEQDGLASLATVAPGTKHSGTSYVSIPVTVITVRCDTVRDG